MRKCNKRRKFLGKASGVAGILGMFGNIATDAAVEKGAIKKGSGAHYTAKMASTAAEWAGIGGMLGSVIPGLGTTIGAGVGALAGSVKGAYDTWKSLPQNADKGILDYAASIGQSLLDGSKNAIANMGQAFANIGKEIEERGGFLTVLWNAVTFKFRVVFDGIKWLLKAIWNPFEAFKNACEKFKTWWNSDNKIGMLWNGLIDSIFGEKKSNGGIVGASPKEVLLETHANGGIVGNDANETRIEKHFTNNIITANPKSAMLNPMHMEELLWRFLYRR